MSKKKPYSDSRWHDYDVNMVEHAKDLPKTERSDSDQKELEKSLGEWRASLNSNK